MTTITARGVVTGAAMLQLIAEHAGMTPRDFETGAWLDQLDPALDITARDIVTGAYVHKLEETDAPPAIFDVSVPTDHDFFTERGETPYVLTIGRHSIGQSSLTIDSPWPTGLNTDEQIEWLVDQLNQKAVLNSLGFTFVYLPVYRQISLTLDEPLTAGDSVVIASDIYTSNLATELFGQNLIII